MTLAELRDKADARLATFWTALVAKEEAYFAKHGKYFQLLVTPTSPVIDGADSTFTLRLRDDNPYRDDITFSFAQTIPFQIKVHEWVGPNGAGFKALVSVVLNGEEYRRERDSNNVDSGWYKYVPPVLIF